MKKGSRLPHTGSCSQSTSFRIDFIAEIQEIKEEGGMMILKQKLVPHPERYEWIEVDGKKCLFDKFDKHCFSPEAFEQIVAGMKGMPLFYEPALVQSDEEYVLQRREPFSQRLAGNYPSPTFEDKSDDFLMSLSTHSLRFVILSLDIVGSTKLSTSLSPERYNLLVTSVSYEISEAVTKYRGHVLKYTGDGIIAYFPEPSFNSKNDLAWDCSITLRKLIYKAINPELQVVGLPPIDVRIGLESGSASVLVIGSESTKQQLDIIGKVVSIAAKIQSRADVGGIGIGLGTIQNLWTERRLMCEEVSTPDDWPYKTEDGNPYPMYRVKVR